MMIQRRDIPLTLLRSSQDRKISKQQCERIRASILAVGLIEPLLVFPRTTTISSSTDISVTASCLSWGWRRCRASCTGKGPLPEEQVKDHPELVKSFGYEA